MGPWLICHTLNQGAVIRARLVPLRNPQDLAEGGLKRAALDQKPPFRGRRGRRQRCWKACQPDVIRVSDRLVHFQAPILRTRTRARVSAVREQ
jgi:hypothetical protein